MRSIADLAVGGEADAGDRPGVHLRLQHRLPRGPRPVHAHRPVRVPHRQQVPLRGEVQPQAGAGRIAYLLGVVQRRGPPTALGGGGVALGGRRGNRGISGEGLLSCLHEQMHKISAMNLLEIQRHDLGWQTMLRSGQNPKAREARRSRFILPAVYVLSHVH